MTSRKLQIGWLLLTYILIYDTMGQSQYGINAVYSLPTGQFAREATHGFGANLNTKFFLGPKVSLGLTGGYILYGEKKDNIRHSAIPVTLDGEYYTREEGARPYISFSGGFVFFTQRQTSDQGASSVSDFHLTAAPAIGVLFDLSRSTALNINAKYLFYTVRRSSYSALSPSIGLYYKIGY